MPQKTRIRNLSTQWLRPLKVWLYVLYAGLCIAITGFYVTRDGTVAGIFLGLGQAGIYIWIFIVLVRVASKLYRVEFDEEFLYVLKRDQDLIIPLENIESVEIATIGGVYKVNLYHADQVGKEFYFKQSLWYPLNYKRCDALVNVLRRNIDTAKRKKYLVPEKALHS